MYFIGALFLKSNNRSTELFYDKCWLEKLTIFEIFRDFSRFFEIFCDFLRFFKIFRDFLRFFKIFEILLDFSRFLQFFKIYIFSQLSESFSYKKI